ncbi:hypothetical protein TALC_00936 [Thermoplasmatales archaeon BRNA1]|nr:hypothetical protein TALC_00936 [Thermoplasmatales archaeon BRNA1]
MVFEIGKEYDRLAITRKFGYSDDKQSMRGGLFFRDNTVILIKDEDGDQYEDRWDPYRPGTLLYYATLKSIPKNKDPIIRDLPINSGANKAFRDGNCPIILFSKSGDSYRYMGEFERTDSDPAIIVKNRYYVPGFEIVSKNPELIEPYIEAFPGKNGGQNWSADEIESFCEMYVPDKLSAGDIRAISTSLNKPTEEIREILDALDGKPSGMVSGKILERIKAGLSEDVWDGQMYIDGYDTSRTVNVRVNQAIFRRGLDKMFGKKCCITGVSQREVLIGSHVYPWRMSSPQEKTNPNNGLLLNKFHDSLFDKYLMTVRMDGTIEYLDSLKKTLGSKVYEKMCKPYDKIEFPERYAPLKKAYEYHNGRFERKAEAESRS